MLWSNRKIRGERQLTCCHSTALWCNKDEICIHFIYFLPEFSSGTMKVNLHRYFLNIFHHVKSRDVFGYRNSVTWDFWWKQTWSVNLVDEFTWIFAWNFKQQFLFSLKWNLRRGEFCFVAKKQKKRYMKREKFVISGKQALTTLNLSKTIEAWGQLKSMNWQKNCNPLLDVKFELTVGLCQFFFWFENFVWWLC